MSAPEHRIEIEVETRYVEEQSDPAGDRYVFAYTITILNAGTRAAQLLARRWVITDANGRVQEVEGEGVVGQQPVLRPGEAFRYTSGAMLETPLGSMEGVYRLVDEAGVGFEAEIPRFTLAVPGILH
ncbi:Co2+/Mg2+ efflux protein ApaG [Inmirania thermothiophila]|uniref:Protein ApaG n=1 Tax=Inmirania thermothiophila TaxID=1750597 RepID=A0A3N1Y815_9GAMM|nr:Co2+/Mg2+ efflux protein ApaG [Inmirania thermothiophila]ROR34661.1 ApaG protein [Inmirania thermothiophila]